MQRGHLVALIAVGALVVIGSAEGLYRLAVRSDSEKHAVTTKSGEKHASLYEPADSQPVEARQGTPSDPIVIADCRINVIDKQDVPSQRDGVLLFVGRVARPDEAVSPERLVTVEIDGKPTKIRRWKEGDRVLPGELLAQLDDRLPRDERAIKQARVGAAQAELASADKMRDEAKSRYDRQLRLKAAAGGATSEEDFKSAKLNWDRAHFDALAKKQSVALAEGELRQAETMLALHQLRCTTPGVIKTIHKQAGEAVRALEAVVQVHKLDRVRVEGVADAHHLSRLRVGMNAEVEPAESDGPVRVLAGHIQDITAVAVCKDGRIVSADEGGAVRIWSKDQSFEDRILRHASPVRSLVCTSDQAKANLCMVGLADGKSLLYDVDSAKEPVHEFTGLHRGPVTCAAFSPDGRYCATGGEDRDIVLLDMEKREIRYRFPAGHRAAISSIGFTPRSEVVSAARDNTIRVWHVGDHEAELVTTFDRRGGDVTRPGVSRDGTRILFDQGTKLRLLSLPEGRTVGVLRQATATTNFTGFALFSPDGQLVLTPTPGESGAILWRSPDRFARGSELRQLASPEGAAVTMAAFSPEGSVIVGATVDRRLLVWSVPLKAEIERRRMAEVVLVEAALDSNARQVRVWAELPNLDGRLLPGGIATLVIYPQKKADEK